MIPNLLSAMNSSFIDRIHHIVLNNISDEKFGVANLASLISLSTSQTLRKVKAATGKSVNQYIREIRLTKAAKLIKKTDLTAAEIAFKVGFSSASYFNRTFHKFYGITPGDYKTQNKSLKELASQKEKINPIHKIIYNKAIVLTTVSILMVFGYLFINNASLYSKPEPFAIAILPFKDFSSDGNSRWFGEGLAEDLRINLSQIKDLRIISRTSTDKYIDTKKLLPEIATDLDVFYLLECSIRKQDSTMLISVQLIDANDNHLWSKSYSGTMGDIFEIQNDVALKIVEQLKITLSPEQEKKITNYPTENQEAYKLFIKAHIIANSRKKEDLELSIELLQKTIDLDPNFAEAYAEMANSYTLLLSYGFSQYDDVKDTIINLLDKSLEIDSNTARIYTIKAYLYGRDYNWKSAIENYKKAIALNPNDATAHHQYGNSFRNRPIIDITNFLNHLNIAHQLDPYSNAINSSLIYALLDNNKIEEAEDHYKQWGNHIMSSFEKTRIESRIKVFKHKNWKEAVTIFESEYNKNPNNIKVIKQLRYLYSAVQLDRKKALKFSRLVYRLDSTSFKETNQLIWQLNLNKKNTEALEMLKDSNTDKAIRKNVHLWQMELWSDNPDNIMDYHNQLKDPEDKVLTFAKLGDLNRINELRSNHYIGARIMAEAHAYLQDRDSMYYYMNKIVRKINAVNLNNRPGFDPYRKEDRYKAFLKNNYLPLTHWNE